MNFNWKQLNTVDPKQVRHVPLTEKIFFVQNLWVMTRAGIPLATAMTTLSGEVGNKGFKAVLIDIAARLEKGNGFSESCGHYPKVFPELFLRMVESGELSGKLEETLKEILEEMKKNHELISKVRGAMIYPAVILCAMIGIGAAMIVFVIPKLTSIFAEVELELPLPTRILIGVSDFVTHHGLLVALSIIFIVAALVKILRTTSGKRFAHSLMINLPILGGIVRKINLARFSRTVGSLLKTDIPIVKTFEITSKTLGNVQYRAVLAKTAEQLKKGIAIHEALKVDPKLFPPTVTQMIVIGEESGSLDEILTELALFYEEEIDQIMKNLPSVIEPILILVMGIGVGGLAVSVILPMYSLTQQF